MQKVLVVSVTLFLLSESLPVNHDSFGFDKLDTDLSNLSYNVEEEDLDDFSKLLEEGTKPSKVKTKVDSSGFKKKNSVKKGEKKNYNLQDLMKFFNIGSAHDAGTHDDGDIYAFLKSLAGQAVGITGNEDRTYKKGTKTRGYHRVLHKDEYKKDKEFYEDDETSGVIKKIGAKGVGVEVGNGVEYDKGYFHHDHDKGLFGKRGLSEKGREDKDYNGYIDSQGFDAYFQSSRRK